MKNKIMVISAMFLQFIVAEAMDSAQATAPATAPVPAAIAPDASTAPAPADSPVAIPETSSGAQSEAPSEAPKELVGARLRIRNFTGEKVECSSIGIDQYFSDDVKQYFTNGRKQPLSIDRLKDRVKLISTAESTNLWERLRGLAKTVVTDVVKNPTNENFEKLVGLYDIFHEDAMMNMLDGSYVLAHERYVRNRLCRRVALFPEDEQLCRRVALLPEDKQLRTEYDTLAEFTKTNFATMCYLYRNIVVFANELGLDPEEFIEMVLKGGDPTSIKDGVIWSTDELTDEKKAEIDAANSKDFEDYWKCLKDCCTKADPSLAPILFWVPPSKVATQLDLSTYVDPNYKISSSVDFLIESGSLIWKTTDSRCVRTLQLQIQLPLRQDMLGEVTPPNTPVFAKMPVFSKKPVGRIYGIGGWKLHVSATPSSAKKVAEAVVPYLIDNGVNFKIVPTTSTLRRLYLLSKTGYYSQYGKFITIYPINKEEGENVAVELDKRLRGSGFSRKDFVTCSGDFSIGKSGALSTRYVADYRVDFCLDNFDTSDQRRVPVIPKTSLEDALEKLPIFQLYYCGI
ncbi:MAG: hypothetical protein LBB21_01155, partial [Holosporaceae bacterium]|nr:hypothetical protein [Holosporaceae bacterium]